LSQTISVADIIAQVESSGNPYAYRFEPTVYESLKTGALSPVHSIIVNRIMKIHSCSLSSAEVIYSSSYGLYQLMGFNLFGECDYAESVWEYLNDPIAQTAMFENLLGHMGLQNYTAEQLASSENLRHQFAIHYNGSSAYEAGIIEACKHLGMQVTE
jgi:hypothetical protein